MTESGCASADSFAAAVAAALSKVGTRGSKWCVCVRVLLLLASCAPFRSVFLFASRSLFYLSAVCSQHYCSLARSPRPKVHTHTFTHTHTQTHTHWRAHTPTHSHWQTYKYCTNTIHTTHPKWIPPNIGTAVGPKVYTGNCQKATILLLSVVKLHKKKCPPISCTVCVTLQHSVIS